jgi:hypothetical protein
VQISLSDDGGATFSHVLADSTDNDGSAQVTLPNVATSRARVKVAAVDNVFFDISDADVVVQGAPQVTVDDPTVQYSDAVPGVVVSAIDADSPGSALTATATGLPAGLTLVEQSTSEHGRSWALAGTVTDAPGKYSGTVAVTDGDGDPVSEPLTVTVAPEDATLAYTGETLSSGSVLLRATAADADDGAPGDIGKATVAFKEGSSTLCAAQPVTGGAVSCRATLPPGTHTVTAVAGGFYAGATSATVQVSRPDRIKAQAAAELIVGSSAGAFSADRRSPLVLALDARAKRGSLSGIAEIAYVHGGRVLRISAHRFQSIGRSADGKRAEVRATADVIDHSWLFWPRVVARNVTLQVSLDEAARAVAISAWDGNTLLFSLPRQAIRSGVISVK